VQRDQLLGLGCSDGQGYLFSRPLTSDQFEAFLVGTPRR
jgi:EAL domain-containing protein (putative c-di-GMP-specific phosphodiesterase class I)